MNLADYVRILARRGWIMLLLAVIVGGSAFLLSRQQTPVYRSTQVVLIQPSRSDFGLTEASRLLLNSYVVFLYSEERAAEIIETLRLDMTPGQLMENATIAPDTTRLVVQIDIDSTDGDQANDIARAWGQKLVDFRSEANQQVQRADRVEAVLPDLPRYRLLSPRPYITGAAGAILGLLIGGVIVFVLEYLESSIVRRSEDLERTIEIPVLASIPRADS
jgi:capsular polysaccharide biosynthesis protein